MFNSPFYHETTKNMVSIFLSMFNDIHVEHVNDSGDVVNTVHVPIKFAPRQKYWELLKINYDAVDIGAKEEGAYNIQIVLPRMGADLISGPTYDPLRKTSKFNNIYECNVEGQTAKSMMQKVPVIYNMQLSVYARRYEEGLRVIEQIVPFFESSLTVRAKMISEMNYYDDITFVLDNVQPINDYDGPVDQKVENMWELDFTVKMYMYKPVVDTPLINDIITNVKLDENGDIFGDI